MDQKEVVHIAPVIFDTQLFLYEVIQPVKVEKGEKLWSLIADRYSDVAFGAVDDKINQPQNVRIGYLLAD